MPAKRSNPPKLRYDANGVPNVVFQTRMPLDLTKEVSKALRRSGLLSRNSYIIQAVREKVARDKQEAANNK